MVDMYSDDLIKSWNVLREEYGLQLLLFLTWFSMMQTIPISWKVKMRTPDVNLESDYTKDASVQLTSHSHIVIFTLNTFIRV